MREIANTQPNILKEQYIPDNVFMYIVEGTIRFFDGNKNYTFQSGDCGVARKNCLAKYTLTENAENFQPVLFCFDEEFLQQFQKKHKIKPAISNIKEAFLKVKTTNLIYDFIRSLKPYYKGVMQLDKDFEDLKYEELLIILLKQQPELAELFFNYKKPEKINLEAFMNKNFKFNVNTQHFAYLTGRSLSAFKRDFKEIFNDTPNHWLVKKRLQEACFLIGKKKQKPSDIYLDLGFETLSHFSYAFKKQFGLTPTELTKTK